MRMSRHTISNGRIFRISFDLDMSRILFVMRRANAPKVQQMDWQRATASQVMVPP